MNQREFEILHLYGVLRTEFRDQQPLVNIRETQQQPLRFPLQRLALRLTNQTANRVPNRVINGTSGQTAKSAGIRKATRTARRLTLGVILFMGLLGTGASLHAQAKSGSDTRTTRKFDWSDLEENKYKLYGSEKEEKFPVSLWPFIEIEDWDKYYSLTLFSLYKYTRYPRFNSITILPLYHHLESKVDDRERFWLFPLIYQKLDGDYSRTVTPLTWKEKRGEDTFRSYFYFFYSNDKQNRLDWALMPLWYTGHEKDGSESYDLLLPLFYRSATNKKRFQDFTLVTPALFVFLENNERSDGKRTRTNFSFSPLHFYDGTTTTRTSNNSETRTTSSGDASERNYTWGVPVLPLLAYRSRKGDVVHQNILTFLMDGTWRKDQLERFWLTPLLYYERGAEDYLHVLPPLFMSFGKRDGPHYQHFLPIYYEWTDKEEETILTLPLFYYNNIRRGKKEQYYHEDTVISPFHYAHTVERGEVKPTREKDILYLSVLQVLPLYYSNKSKGEGAHRNVLGLIDWSYHKDNSLRRSMFLPLYFYGRDTDNAVFQYITPLFMQERSSTHTAGLYGGLYYHASEENEYTSLLFPLWYRNANRKQDASFTYATPLYFRSATPDTDKGLISLLWYYSRNYAVDSNLNSLIPLYLYSRTGSETSFYSWLYFHNSRKFLSGNERRDLLPFLSYRESTTTDAQGKTAARDFSFWWSMLPIYLPNLPVFYFSRDDQGSHVNVLSLFDWRTDKAGGLRRFWSPFLFYGREAYTHIPLLAWFSWHGSELYEERSYLAPLFYHNNSNVGWSTLAGPLWMHSDREATFNFHFLPLFYSWKDSTSKTNLLAPLYYYSAHRTQTRPGASRRETSFVSPLAYYSNSTVRRDAYFKRRSRTLLPILPVLYYGSEESDVGSTRTLMTLFHWQNDKEDKLSRFWALPLAFYQRDEYFHLIPFFFRPGGYNAEEGWSFSPLLYYHSWSRDHDRLLAGPYYTHSNTKENTDLAILFPTYWAWDNPTSKGQLILPFVYEYEDKRKYVNINALGLSRTRNVGKVAFGTTQTGRWYLDTDIAWLYNMVSVSARVSVASPFGDDTPAGGGDKKSGGDAPKSGDGPTKSEPAGTGDDDKNAPNLAYFRQLDVKQVGEKQFKKLEKTKSPHFTRKNNIVRSEAEYFWGLSIAYGWLAYEVADTKRHFRMFPFAWFSWDTRSDDRVNTIPFLYLSYKSEELSYFALFPAFLPLYGRQREGKSFIEVYGALWPVFIREYDDEEKRNEYSVLWPFYNQHSSPRSGGFRLFPLVWHKTNRYQAPPGEQGAVASSRTLSPFYYQSFYRTREARDKQPAGRPVLVDRDGKTTGTRPEAPAPVKGPVLETAVRRLFILPFAPLWYRHTSTRSVLPEGTQAGARVAPDSRSTTTWSYLFPLYLYRAGETQSRARTGERFTLVGLPLLYYDVLTERKTSTENSPADAEARTRTTNFFLLGYYAHSSPAQRSNSFLFGLFSRKVLTKEKTTKTSLLYGLISSSSRTDGGGAWALPFYYSALQISKPRPGQSIREQSRMAPILLTFYSSRHEDLGTRTRRKAKFYSPLFWYSSTSRSAYETKSSRNNTGTKTVAAYNATSWFLPVPGLYGQSTTHRMHYNWLLFADWQYNKKDDHTEWYAFPLLFYESGKNGHFTLFPIFWNYRNAYRKSSALHFAPLYFSWSRPDYSTYIIAGLYLHFSANRSRQNFFYLFDHNSEPRARRDTWSALFGAAYMQFTPRRNKYRLFYGLLFGLDYYKETKQRSASYDYNFLWMRRISDASSTHFSFVPLWWYDSNRRDSSLLVLPPLLSFVNLETTSRGNVDNIYFLAGLYWRTNENYRRRNLLFLADYTARPKNSETTWNFLLGTVHLNNTPEQTNFHLFYRLFGGVEYRDGRDYDFNVAWYIQYREQEHFHSSLIPLWYYGATKTSSTLVIPPLLTYADRDASGVFQLVGLGSVWYRNYDSYSQRDRRSILLGLLYGDVRKPKNGYRSVHSLWGFLWEYQRESETGWSKFSILKLPVYKKVQRVGRTRTYIMGVRLD